MRALILAHALASLAVAGGLALAGHRTAAARVLLFTVPAAFLWPLPGLATMVATVVAVALSPRNR